MPEFKFPAFAMTKDDLAAEKARVAAVVQKRINERHGVVNKGYSAQLAPKTTVPKTTVPAPASAKKIDACIPTGTTGGTPLIDSKTTTSTITTT